MPLSHLQLEANRNNAQFSTGPRTGEGKQRSSLNATRHGLTGQVVLLPQEDTKLYQSFCQEFVQEWQPQGPTEKHLVQTLADQQWRLHRAHARERAVYAVGMHDLGDRIDTDRPEVHSLLTSALVDIEHSKELERLSRYGSRIQRDYQNTLQTLQKLQSERKASEKEQLERAALLQKFFEMKKVEWNPAELGFVLTMPQIRANIRLETHLKQAKAAASVGFDRVKYNRAAA